MHVRQVLTTARPLPLAVLSATGIVNAVPLLVAGMLVTVVFPHGEIEHIGPLSVQPAIPVILLVPALLAVACAVAHGTWASPVVRRGSRTHLARALSYSTVLGCGTGVVLLGSLLGGMSLLGGTLRNLLWLTAAALIVASLCGASYAWLPVVVAFGSAVLSSPSDDPWTLNGWMFHAEATTGQLVVAVLTCLAGMLLAIWDPMNRGYLPRSRERKAQIRSDPP